VPSASKASYEEKKARERNIRKLEKQIARCEEAIERMETKAAGLEAIIADPALDQEKVRSGEVFKEYEDIKQQLRLLEAEWEGAHLKLEELSGE